MKNLTETFISKKKSGQKFASLTAYDYPMGRLLDEAGLDFLLVGDSLGMVVLGYPDTTAVTLADIIHHTRAVTRGVTKTPVIADLPAHTADCPEGAVENARQLVAAGADGVKLEGGRDMLPSIRAILAENIPVLGHIGMLPQRVHEEGGYRIKGKTPQQAEALLEDARSLDEAGVMGMVLELVSPPLAKSLSAAVRSPTIGIGSGPDCDGQILVTPDLLGMFPWFRPKFVQPKADLASEIQRAVAEYIRECRGQAG